MPVNLPFVCVLPRSLRIVSGIDFVSLCSCEHSGSLSSDYAGTPFAVPDILRWRVLCLNLFCRVIKSTGFDEHVVCVWVQSSAP